MKFKCVGAWLHPEDLTLTDSLKANKQQFYPFYPVRLNSSFQPVNGTQSWNFSFRNGIYKHANILKHLWLEYGDTNKFHDSLYNLGYY